MVRAVASMGQRGPLPSPQISVLPPPPDEFCTDHSRSLAAKKAIASQDYYYARLTHQSHYANQLVCRVVNLFY